MFYNIEPWTSYKAVALIHRVTARQLFVQYLNFLEKLPVHDVISSWLRSRVVLDQHTSQVVETDDSAVGRNHSKDFGT